MTSTGYILFTSLFHCRTKAMHLIDMEEVKERGFITTTLDDYDEQLANELREVYLPVSEIAELFADGCDVELMDAADALRMYEIISNHMDWWAIQFAETLYIESGRLRRVQADLEKLDRLAESVYGLVKSHINRLTTPVWQGGKQEAKKPAPRRRGSYTMDDSLAAPEARIGQHVTLEERFPSEVLKRVRAWDKPR